MKLNIVEKKNNENRICQSVPIIFFFNIELHSTFFLTVGKRYINLPKIMKYMSKQLSLKVYLYIYKSQSQYDYVLLICM